MGIEGYQELIGRFGGCSFNHGLYRLHSAETGAIGQELAVTAFPALLGRFRVFGYDWLGRQFAVDLRSAEALILMLEPGTGEALEIPASFRTFHDEEMVNYLDAVVAVNFYRQWRFASGFSGPLGDRECVGYEIPLFLGGSDTVENLTLSDWEVYWHLTGQLLAQTRGLPTETGVRGVTQVDESKDSFGGKQGDTD